MLTARGQELSAIERLLLYARDEATELKPAPIGLVAALSVAIEEVRTEARQLSV